MATVVTVVKVGLAAVLELVETEGWVMLDNHCLNCMSSNDLYYTETQFHCSFRTSPRHPIYSSNKSASTEQKRYYKRKEPPRCGES